jgi:hypothetical protein
MRTEQSGANDGGTCGAEARLILRSPCCGVLGMTLIGPEDSADGKHLGKAGMPADANPHARAKLSGPIPTFPLLVPAKSHDVAKVGFYYGCLHRKD